MDDRTAPICLIDFEGGFQTLRGLPGEGELWVQRKVRTWADLEKVGEELDENEFGFQSTGIDSISETQLFALFTILDEQRGRRKDPDRLQQDDYGKAMIQLRRFVRYFRDLPMHVLMTAQARDVTDPREGLIKKPALSGQLADDIPGMFDVVGYLAMVTTEDDKALRSLLLHSYPKVRTKARSPWGVELPEHIDNPDVTKLLDVMGY